MDSGGKLKDNGQFRNQIAKQCRTVLGFVSLDWIVVMMSTWLPHSIRGKHEMKNPRLLFQSTKFNFR